MHHWRQSQCHLDTSTWLCCELIESPPPSKHQLLGNMEWIDCLHCFTCNCFSPFLKCAVHSFASSVKVNFGFKTETFSFGRNKFPDEAHMNTFPINVLKQYSDKTRPFVLSQNLIYIQTLSKPTKTILASPHFENFTADGPSPRPQRQLLKMLSKLAT